MQMNKTLVISLLVTLFGLSNMGCGEGSSQSDKVDNEAVEKQQQQYQTHQPTPFFERSLERGVAIQLYAARNERVATWTIWRSNTGKVLGDCPSIGYPIPYDVQLTNPVKITRTGTSSGHYGYGVVEQAEPNGLYSSKNSISTWVRCIMKVGDEDVEAPIYVEDKVTAYPFPVNVNYETDRVKPVEGAKPTVTIEVKKAE